MTTPPKIYKTEAIVLRHLPLGEADHLLTLYTPNGGRMKAVARGARRIKSRLGGHLEPLMRTTLLLARGRTLDVVSQAEALEGFRTVREDLHRLSQALYMAELVDAITPEEQPNYPLYRLLLGSLRCLATAPSPLLLPLFQMHVLDHTGFRPELYQCVECGADLARALHRFSPERGGALCDSCRPPQVAILSLSVDALKALRFLQREECDTVGRLYLEQAVLQEVQRLLAALLRHVLGREVRASRMLDLLAHEGLREGADALSRMEATKG